MMINLRTLALKIFSEINIFDIKPKVYGRKLYVKEQFRLNYASATVDKYDSFIPDILCNCVSDAINRNRN